MNGLEALKLFKKDFAPADGYFNTLLYTSDWRLDLIHDSRLASTAKPVYCFIWFGERQTGVRERKFFREEKIIPYLTKRLVFCNPLGDIIIEEVRSCLKAKILD